jgi:hypothetical protein
LHCSRPAWSPPAGFFGIASTGCFARASWRQQAALALAPAGVVVLLILASYYQYGTWGFERHRTFCQCMVMQLMLVLGWIAAQWRPISARHGRVLGPLCLMAAVIVCMSARLPAIEHDYRLLPAIRAARDATWDSGMAPSTGAMRFELPPNGRIIEGMAWQPGHYGPQSGRADIPWYAEDVVRYFSKHSIEIMPGSPTASP